MSGDRDPTIGEHLPEDFDAAFLAGILEASPDPYVVVDLDGVIRWASPSAAGLVGVAHEDYVGHHVSDFVAPGSLPAALEAFGEYTSPDRADTGWIGPPLPVDLQHRDGHPVPCEIRRVPTAEPFAGVVLLVSTSGPMTALYESIERIVSDEPLDVVVRSILRLVEVETPFSIPVLGLGWDGTGFARVVASDEAPTFDGQYLPAVPDGRSPWHVRLTTGASIADDDLDAVDAMLAEGASAVGAQACWVLPIAAPYDADPDGSERATADDRNALVLWRRAPGPPRLNVERRLDRVLGLIGLALRSDLTRRELRWAARTDAVTGLPNRRALSEHFRTMASRPPAGRVGVLFCDLDRFKQVNDRFGHPTGDRALRVAAERMRSRLRASDVVARVGGDEFVVVTVAPDDEPVEHLARRVLDAFAAPIVLGDLSVEVGVSIGIASAPAAELGRSTTGDDLVARADHALLRSKADGARRITWS